MAGRDIYEFLSGQTNSRLRDPGYAGEYDPLATRRAAEAQQSRLFGAQQGLEGQIQARLEGRAPSVAEMQMQRSARDAQSQIASQAQGARGMNRMLAQREAIDATARSQAQIAEAGAQMRAQEQAAAEGRMVGLLGQQQAAALQQQGLASGEQTALMNAQQQAQMARWQQSRDNQEASSAFGGGLIKTGVSLLGGLSDERAKRDIDRDIEEEVQRRLAGLDPVAFRYRDGMGPPGRQMGIMAQDAERVGANITRQDPGTGMRRIDGDRALNLSLAGLGNHEDRLSQLEARLGGRAR